MDRAKKKYLKKLALFLVIYLTIGFSCMVAVQCSWICMPVSWVIGAAGLFLVEYYADNKDKFN